MGRKEEEQKLLESYFCPEADPLGTSGVLLSDEIKYYVQQFKLIDPFDEKNLKPAGYELTVGHRCAIGGNSRELLDEPGKNEVNIPPFEVLIVQTRERVNLPRFLIGRWNIRVAWAYKGLLWVGGPQVDPGFVGYLSCPIYNLSSKEVTLRIGEPIALLDFVKTTPFKRDSSLPYRRPPTRVLFEDYQPNDLKSALFTQAGEKLRSMEGDIRQFQERIEDRVERLQTKSENSLESIHTRVNAVTAIIFTALAILVGSLSILVGSFQKITETFPWWFFLSIALSIVAIVCSGVALSKARVRRLGLPADVSREIGKLERTTNFLAMALVVIIVLNVFIIWKIFLE